MNLRHTWVLPLGLMCCALGSAAAPVDMPALIGELSSAACQGRRAGEPGCALAAARLERELTALGLAPLDGFPGQSQFFAFRTAPRVDKARLGRIRSLGGMDDLRAEDWTILAASSSGFLHAPVLFCGYGISAPGLGWNDYRDATLAGKAVLLVRQVPEGLGPGTSEWLDACRLDARIAAARAGGAAAVLVADSPFSDRPELARGTGPDAAVRDAGLLLAGISATAADSLLASTGQSLRTLISKVGRLRQAQPALNVACRLEMEVRISAEERVSRNLGAAIPGRGAAARRWILLGAHYDHLGRGADGAGALHPGADDNASGTAMALAVAQEVQARLSLAGGDRRSLAIVLFSGEEQDRLGSRHLLEAGPAWLDSLDLMVNLDMVGRLREGKLQVLGGKDHPELLPLFAAAATQSGLTVAPCPEGPGGDHESFRNAGVPAIMIFTGPHADYHKPSDTLDRLNLDGLSPIRDVLTNLLPALLDPGLGVARDMAAMPRREAGAEPVRVAIGIVPGYESAGGGMPVADVRPGSAAEEAGVRKGDLILSLGPHPVANVYDYTFALRHFGAGDEVQLSLLRDGRRHQLTVRVETRVR